MLKFAIINDSDKEKDFGSELSLPNAKDYRSVDAVSLVDTVGKKKYLTIHDSDGHCLCSQRIVGIPAKERVNVWAKFPAPPENVKKISVVVPHFAPMDDVPINR